MNRIIITEPAETTLLESIWNWFTVEHMFEVMLVLLLAFGAISILLTIALAIMEFFDRRTGLVGQMRGAKVDTRVNAAMRLLAAYLPVEHARGTFWVDLSQDGPDQAAFQVRLPGGAPIAVGGDAVSAVLKLLAPDTKPSGFRPIYDHDNARYVRNIVPASLTEEAIAEIEAAFDLDAPEGSILFNRQAERRSRQRRQAMTTAAITTVATSS